MSKPTRFLNSRSMPFVFSSYPGRRFTPFFQSTPGTSGIGTADVVLTGLNLEAGMNLGMSGLGQAGVGSYYNYAHRKDSKK